jgi:hypothetical protein
MEVFVCRWPNVGEAAPSVQYFYFERASVYFFLLENVLVFFPVAKASVISLQKGFSIFQKSLSSLFH